MSAGAFATGTVVAGTALLGMAPAGPLLPAGSAASAANQVWDVALTADGFLTSLVESLVSGTKGVFDLFGQGDETVPGLLTEIGLGQATVGDALGLVGLSGNSTLGGVVDEAGLGALTLGSLLSDFGLADTSTLTDVLDQFRMGSMTIGDLLGDVGLHGGMTITGVLAQWDLSDTTLGTLLGYVGLSTDSTIGEMLHDVGLSDDTTLGTVLSDLGLSDSTPIHIPHISFINDIGDVLKWIWQTDRSTIGDTMGFANGLGWLAGLPHLDDGTTLGALLGPIGHLVAGDDWTGSTTLGTLVSDVHLGDTTLDDLLSTAGLSETTTLDGALSILGLGGLTVGGLLGDAGLSDATTVDGVLHTLGLQDTTLSTLLGDFGLSDTSTLPELATDLFGGQTLDQLFSELLTSLGS